MEVTSLTYLLTTFAAKHRDFVDKLMKEIGLHGGQVFVLNLLWNNDGQSQADIVKSLNLSAPSVYNMATRLADNGFIEIKKDVNDARIMRLFLTQKGKEIEKDVNHQWQKLEDLTLAALTEPERMMFSMLFQKLLEGQK